MQTANTAAAAFAEAVSALVGEPDVADILAHLVADCASELAEHDPDVWRSVNRYAENGAVQQFVPLSARYTALQDMADRLGSNRKREGQADATEPLASTGD